MVRIVVAGGLLAGPTALAFASGGYFDRPRTIAGLVAWALVVLLAVTRAPMPRSRAAWAAIAGLAGLTAWTAVSLGWAPLSEPARDDVGRLIVYLGALIASALAWRRRDDLRLVEPVLAAGVLLVCLYALSERLVPGLVDLEPSATAAGRLEQPLTYWNALGMLAALGLTLAIRVAGTPGRQPWLRAAAAAAAAPLGMALYLTFSRGAIAALAVGAAVLLLLTPTRAQLRAALLATGAAIAAAVTAGLLPAVESAEEDASSAQGAAALVALIALGGLTAFLQRRDPGADERAYALPRRAVAGAIAAVVLFGAPLAAVTLDREAAEPGATASRLDSLGSNRYDYWRVALEAWRDQPLRGSGTAAFRVDWLREREIDEPVRDAHSLYLEIPAELGTVGLLLFLLFAGGLAGAAVAAVRRDRELVAGSAAAVSLFAAHAAIDWDWELPAATLPALVAAGVLLCRAGPLRAAGTAS